MSASPSNRAWITVGRATGDGVFDLHTGKNVNRREDSRKIFVSGPGSYLDGTLEERVNAVAERRRGPGSVRAAAEINARRCRNRFPLSVAHARPGLADACSLPVVGVCPAGHSSP